MEYLQSCRASVYEITTLTSIHVRVYHRQGSQGEARAVVQESLKSARVQLNEHGIFAAVDVNAGKILVFAPTRGELESLLKPFHRLVGAKITLACRDDLAFDFVNQRDFSLREFLSQAQSDKSLIATPGSTNIRDWPHFRGTFLGALQDFVMMHTLRSSQGIQLDRHSILLDQSTRDVVSPLEAHGSQLSPPNLITVHVDFVSSGRVLASVKTATLVHLTRVPRLALSHSTLSDNKQAILMPLMLRVGLFSNLDDSFVVSHRAAVQQWLNRRKVIPHSEENEEEWVNIVIDLSSTIEGRDTESMSSSRSEMIVPWPRKYLLLNIAQDPSARMSQLGSFLDNEPDIFTQIQRWKAEDSAEHQETETGLDPQLQMPEIPADICHDLPGTSAALSPDTIMRDAVAESQQAGIYPTPSDGLASHQTPASFNNDSPHIVSSQSHDSQTTSGLAERAAKSDEDHTAAANQQGHHHQATASAEPTVTDDDFDYFNVDSLAAAPSQDDVRTKGDAQPQYSAKERESEVEVKASDQVLVRKDRLGGQSTESPMQLATDGSMRAEARQQQTTNSIKHPINIAELNLKYRESGVFRTSQAISSATRETQQVPHVGLPSDSSSDEATDFSESSDEAGSPMDVARSPFDRATQLDGAADVELNEDDSDSEEQTTLALLRQLLGKYTNIPEFAFESLLNKDSFLHWNHVQWLFDDLEPEACINIMQNIVSEVVLQRKLNAGANGNTLKATSNVNSVVPQAHHLDLLSLAVDAHEDGAMLAASLSSLSPKSKRNEQEKRAQLRQSLKQLEVPHVRVHRHGIQYSMLPTAVQFSDSLGLEPINGPKPVIAVCVSPIQGGVATGVSLFQNVMEDAYVSRQFGGYEKLRLEDIGDNDGHVSLPHVDRATSLHEISKLYNHASRELGARLAELDVTHLNVVVFLVDTLEDHKSKLILSASFQHLLESFKAMSRKRSENEDDSEVYCGSIKYLIIPGSYVHNDVTISLPALTPLVRNRLACHIYDSVGHNIPEGVPFNNLDDVKPAIELDPHTFATIPFEITEQPPQHLLWQDMSLHVAYNFTDCQDWLVACWTDNTGRYQASRTYPLKHQQLSTILEEIWQSTLAVVENEVGRTIRWRLFLAKVGCLQADEFKAWVDVIGEQPNNVSVYLIAVETKPKFTVRIPALPDPTGTPEQDPGSVVNKFLSPGSTPAPTPDAAAPEADPSARLIDLTDQAWSLILSFQPNTSENPFVYIPSVLSALLIKRLSEHDHDPPALMQVNLMKVMLGSEQHKRGVPDNRVVMEELLKMYNGLGVLARLRGQESKDSVRPLHIGFAEQAVGGLEELLGL